MKCTRCNVIVRVSKERFLSQKKLCGRCHKQYKKIGNNLKRVSY